MNLSNRIRGDFFDNTAKKETLRFGFGKGLSELASENEKIVGLCADLTDSVEMTEFSKKYPKRFIEVGIAEQNMVCVASGLAKMDMTPYVGGYSAFSPGRNWEQIKTTIAINDMPVKIIGSHSGLNVGPDGATHQMLEDISLMRSMPNMQVFSPGDSIEAEIITKKIANTKKPAYLRIAREKMPVFNKEDVDFEIGKAYTLVDGEDISIFSTGVVSSVALKVAKKLKDERGISAEVVHFPTIKPLDIRSIVSSLEKTGRAVTLEEAQIYGGFGSSVCETASLYMPAPIMMIGVDDSFGQSGTLEELWSEYGIDEESVFNKTINFIERVPKYRKGF